MHYVQSLEALRDGEHEKQRRHFLYFLLHQVPVSSNFSVLARRIGHKVVLVFLTNTYLLHFFFLGVKLFDPFIYLHQTFFFLSDCSSYCTQRLQDEPSLPSL